MCHRPSNAILHETLFDGNFKWPRFILIWTFWFAVIQPINEMSIISNICGVVGLMDFVDFKFWFFTLKQSEKNENEGDAGPILFYKPPPLAHFSFSKHSPFHPSKYVTKHFQQNS